MLAAAVTGALALASGASAHSGDFAKFNDCPSTTAGVSKCIHAVTTGGQIVLGKKTTPIINPVTLQGGVSSTNEEKAFIEQFYGASDGNTLTKAPQPLPGGLLGIIPPEKTPGWLKTIISWFTENSLTGVNAVLELARPASEIQVSEYNLLNEEGVALKLPVKVHLENPFLGGSCYIGSSSSPLIWNLTTGTTSPPGPNKPISGTSGTLSSKDENEIITLTNTKLVDNAWSAPEANGCGGILGFIVNPIINSMVGLPSAAGSNTAELINTIDTATVGSVNEH
jgi:hypothetical protein